MDIMQTRSWCILRLSLVLASGLVVLQSLTTISTSLATNGLETSELYAVQSTDHAHFHSYGYFDDIPNEKWERMRLSAINAPQYRGPLHGKQIDPVGWYINNLNPSFNCFHQQRVGGVGDGPKFVCDPVCIPCTPSRFVGDSF